MLNITKSGNSLVVEGVSNKAYPDNGKLSIPMNSVIIVLDNSEFVTFRSSANNNVYFSANINQIRISGAAVTKQTIIAAFDTVANASGGSGGGGDVEDVERKLNQEILNRISADTELSQLLDSEKTARQNGDNNLQNQVNNITSDAVKASVSGTTLVLDKIV